MIKLKLGSFSIYLNKFIFLVTFQSIIFFLLGGQKKKKRSHSNFILSISPSTTKYAFPLSNYCCTKQ